MHSLLEHLVFDLIFFHKSEMCLSQVSLQSGLIRKSFSYPLLPTGKFHILAVAFYVPPLIDDEICGY